MSQPFTSFLANDLEAFLEFKRTLGYKYERPEFTLRRFDRFVAGCVEGEPGHPLDRLVLDWLSSMPGRKSVSVASELGVVRQFCLFLRRRDPDGFVPGRAWAPGPAQSQFLPHIFSLTEISVLLELTGALRPTPFRPLAVRTLILMLYCTGLRFGEALWLRVRDVDLDDAVLFIEGARPECWI